MPRHRPHRHRQATPRHRHVTTSPSPPRGAVQERSRRRKAAREESGLSPPTSTGALATPQKRPGDGSLAGQPVQKRPRPLDLPEALFVDDDSERPVLASAPPFPKEPLVLQDEGGGRKAVAVPASIAQYLRDYQRAGVRFLFERYAEGAGGLLGDDMGLGKTVQVIAFLAALLGKRGTRAPDAEARRARRMALLVVPATLISQWKKELEVWGFFRAEVYHGSASKREEVLDAAIDRKYEVVLTSYATLRSGVEEIGNMVAWDVVFFDEVHKLKSSRTQTAQSFRSLRCPCRYGLSGTVVQNRLEELHSVLDFLVPGCLGSLAEYKTTFADPILSGQKYDASTRVLATGRASARRLAARLAPHVLARSRRVIASQLPAKKDIIVFCSLSDRQREAYARALEGEDVQLLINRENPCPCGSGEEQGKCCFACNSAGLPWKDLVFPCMQQLTKIANHLGLLLPEDNEDPDKARRTRAFCKVALGTDKQAWGVKELADGTAAGLSCKLDVLCHLLDQWHAARDKVLLFSTSTRLNKFVARRLAQKGYRYLRLDGSVPTSKRGEVVGEFNDSPASFALLMTTQVGGLGLNLTAANRVAIIDPSWNPGADLQAQDRAFRIGQSRDVAVYRLIAAGTMEEMVYNRQLYKQQLTGSLTGAQSKRYFSGVQGKRGEEGEIFGLRNLFSTDTYKVMTDAILRRHEKAEARFRLEELQIINEEERATAATSDRAAATSAETVDQEGRAASILDAVLALSGVASTHTTEEVTGESNVERAVYRRAKKMCRLGMTQEPAGYLDDSDGEDANPPEDKDVDHPSDDVGETKNSPSSPPVAVDVASFKPPAVGDDQWEWAQEQFRAMAVAWAATWAKKGAPPPTNVRHLFARHVLALPWNQVEGLVRAHNTRLFLRRPNAGLPTSLKVSSLATLSNAGDDRVPDPVPSHPPTVSVRQSSPPAGDGPASHGPKDSSGHSGGHAPKGHSSGCTRDSSDNFYSDPATGPTSPLRASPKRKGRKVAGVPGVRIAGDAEGEGDGGCAGRFEKDDVGQHEIVGAGGHSGGWRGDGRVERGRPDAGSGRREGGTVGVATGGEGRDVAAARSPHALEGKSTNSLPAPEGSVDRGMREAAEEEAAAVKKGDSNPLVSLWNVPFSESEDDEGGVTFAAVQLGDSTSL